MDAAEKTVRLILEGADIAVNGSRIYDIQVHDQRFYKRVLAERELGIGESYMDGWWSVGSIDQLTTKLLTANLRESMRPSFAIIRTVLLASFQNKQTKNRANRNAKHHYNIGNELYELMLDKRMIYSCAYWKDAKSLDEAQLQKLDLICRKLELTPGMKVLDIGCGWGGFAEYAAEKYGVEVVGISPAEEQIKLARERVRNAGVSFEVKDYRELDGVYDRIVSIGMLEHVGPKNYSNFFALCNRLLADDGMMLHHTIGNNRSVNSTDPWIDRYIFPGGVVPSIAQIGKAIEKRFIIEDLQNLGPDYDKTLLAWHKNFKDHYPKIQKQYGDTFCRMWEFYLLSCAGLFRSRKIQLYQIVMRKPLPSAIYISPR